MKFLKMMKIYFIFFFCIVFSMFLSMLIPKEWIKENAKESIMYSYNQLIKTKTNADYPYYLETDAGDIQYSEMVYLVDSKHPIKSMIEMNSNISGDLKEEATWNYHEYARYWHGPILYLRPLMVLYNLEEIYSLQLIVLIIVTIVLMELLWRFDKIFSISTLISFVMFSVYSVYHNISYFNCMIISMIGLIILILLHQKKKIENAPIVFMVLGLFTCFFDFYTIDTITITLPLLLYVLVLQKEKKEISVKNILKIIGIWFVSYLFPFILKWMISSIYLGNGILTDIFHRMKTEGNNLNSSISVMLLLYRNTKLIIPFYYIEKYIYIVVPFLLLATLITIFYTSQGTKKGFFIIFLLCIGRILLVPIQANQYPFSTFRNLIPIGIIMFYVILKEVREGIKKHNK